MDQDIFTYQETDFYSWLFDESENAPFEVPSGRTKTYYFKKQYPMIQGCMFYSKITVLICYVHCHLKFYLIGDKISAGCFKDEITPSLKANDRLRSAQDVTFKNVKEKVKPRCKL